jgi:hypothetical protein
MKSECRDFKKARANATGGRERESNDVTESAKIATVAAEIKSDISIYTASNAIDVKWVLDSGTSKHMCGDRTLFTSLKRFAEPQFVKLADDSRIQAYGKCMIILETGNTHGPNLKLTKAWYVPELGKVRLISILTLNDHGVEVIFKPRRTVEARKDNKVIFTGLMQQGLVCLDLEPVQRPKAYTAAATHDTLAIPQAIATESTAIPQAVTTQLPAP